MKNFNRLFITLVFASGIMSVAQSQQKPNKTKPQASAPKKTTAKQKNPSKPKATKKTASPVAAKQKLPVKSVVPSAQDAYIKNVTGVLVDLRSTIEKMDTVMEDLDSNDMKNPSSLNPTGEIGAWTDEDKRWSAARDARRLAVTTPVRAQLNRLKGITVIPRSMAPLDARLTQYTLEMSRYLDILDQGSASYSKPARQQRDTANEILDGVLKELSVKTDPAVKKKVYVDG